jgi:hypothetical protein
MKKKQEDDLNHYNNRYDDLNKIHTTCERQIKNLSTKNEEL